MLAMQRDKPNPQRDLLRFLARFTHDPLGFVMACFPWGQEATALAKHDGPDEWQRDVLTEIGNSLEDDPWRKVQIAIASGHGIGKSALVAWLIIWAMATHEETRGVITANTENQLRTKTWAELTKWFNLCLARHIFRLEATSLASANRLHEKTWHIDMTPWSERNTEAFAGLHNQGKRLLVIFDEASAIPNLIWETTEGALTDKETEIIWCAFGNPTRNTGRFRDCFGRLKANWLHKQIDSRAVKITDKGQIAKWAKDYGDDSDFFRVRVRGVFPRAGSMQFFSSEMIEACRAHPGFKTTAQDPLVLGVDVARFGDDKSVIFPRKGRDCRTIAPIKLSGVDTMTLASRVLEETVRLRADAVFVDETGLGAGVVDRLRQLNCPGLIGVQFGAKADGAFLTEHEKFANKRSEMYGTLRQAMRAGLALPANDADLLQELEAIEYGYNVRDEIQLEAKDQMKTRDGSPGSPDTLDALALTYAYPVMAGVHANSVLGGGSGEQPGRMMSDFEPY